ncbi:unnamed protein product [Moneuplotes crassus]|uniref:Uncharacterized protein n=1 Tax=Euplotes crassus TaxID=5936 RepID=A0AAD1XA92_EUPCR|nr:unnamed protein product [Moneuplotes crassus]
MKTTCTRKELFQRLGLLMNILPYYAKMPACDTLMRRFSTKTRSLWNKNLPLWIDYLQQNLHTIIIDERNLSYWTENPLIHQCECYFKASDLLKKYYCCRVIKFAKSVQRIHQINKIVIKLGNGHQNALEWNDDVHLLLENLNKISQGLGCQPSPIKFINLEQNHYFYFSDIFEIKNCRRNLIKRINIIPKVKDTFEIICVDSLFLLNNKQVIINENLDLVPDVSSFEVGDRNIPIFDSVQECEIINLAIDCPEIIIKLNLILAQYYPNLKTLRCNFLFETAFSKNLKILEMIELTNITMISNTYKPDCYKMTEVKASGVVLLNYQNETISEGCFTCVIEAKIKLTSQKDIIDGHILIKNFDVRTIGNCTRIENTEQISSLMEKFRNNSNILSPGSNYTLLVIQLSKISSIKECYSSFLNNRPSDIRSLSHLFVSPEMHAEFNPNCSIYIDKLCPFFNTFRFDILTNLISDYKKNFRLKILLTGCRDIYSQSKTHRHSVDPANFTSLALDLVCQFPSTKEAFEIYCSWITQYLKHCRVHSITFIYTPLLRENYTCAKLTAYLGLPPTLEVRFQHSQVLEF